MNNLTYPMHHISLLSGDFDKNFDFYVNVLGFRFIKNSINQANTHMRHVYYGDFMGTPGTVVTFFPDPTLDRDRVDGKFFFNGIFLAIPNGTKDYWTKRLEEKNVEFTDKGDYLDLADYEGTPLRLYERDGQAFDWHINFMSDIPYDKQLIGIIGSQLNVTDVKASGDFFAKWLNLEVQDNQIVLDNGQMIELVQTATDAPDSKFGRGSTDHIALSVTSSHDLDELWASAEKLGLKREVYIDRGYFNSIYVIEPSGNRVEIATTNPGFTLDESVLDLGTTFSLPPRFDGPREEIVKFWQEQNINFHQVEPYTGTGKIDNAPVQPEFDQRGNTYNG